ncbi:hypothetical protein [Shewanella youngdeokensis]|uniref:Lipoprotein n=1 Tax=Shewanella youngdeokensis TaxID=2999068 RepID=A0ABZ0K2A3_9GAMM|nr:hypothetical protein RGE70_07865 [Shewanella sp. DAU334]
MLKFIKLKLVFFYILYIGLAISCDSYAAITITELQPLKYPAAIKNIDKSTTVLVNWKGQLGGATNSVVLNNDYYQGKYLITSNTNRPITIELIQLGNENKIKLKTLRVRYKNKTYKSFPTVQLENPGIEGELIEIGAKVVAAKRATTGEKYPQYTLTIEEQ